MREIIPGEIKKEEETLRVERDELRKNRYFGHLTLSKVTFSQRVILQLDVAVGTYGNI